MSIFQVSTQNTFGQLITAVSAVIAVANNFTDGPQSQTGSTWTFTNANVGVNVIGTLLSTNANVSLLNTSQANVTNETVSRSNVSTANITVANVVGATITNLNTTNYSTANANVSVLLQVSDRANIYSANIQFANIGTVAITSLSVTSLTVPVLNASFANITSLSVTGTSQHQALIATLVTTTNANVGLLNASTANITGETVGTSNISTANISTANITFLTVGTQNISFGNITSATMATLNVSFANITSANVVSANIGLANIVNTFIATLNTSSANITTGTMAANPTTNLGIATKNYADTGAGGNLVNKITYVAKGDLIPGTGANTFSVLTSGSNGQSLIVDTTQTTGLRWATRGQSQTFRGLSMGTSQADKVANGTQLIVHRLDEAVMDDGEVVTGWSVPTTLDITSNGAVNLLDTGVVLANTWYEVYAIRKRSDGTKGFIIHRAIDRNPDQNTMNTIQWATGTYGSVGANTTVNPNVRVAMSFTPNVTGNLTSIEIRAFKTTTPTGNMWLTLEANSAGVPSGTTLATSRKLDVGRAITTASFYSMRYVFDTPATLTAGTSYFWVYNSDYVASATAFMNVSYSTQASNGSGGVNPGVPMGNTGAAWVNLTPGVGAFVYKAYIEANSTAVTMPAGYDQKCLISYVATDNASKFREFRQQDRTIYGFFSAQWMGWMQVLTDRIEIADFRGVLPPVTVQAAFHIPTGLGSYYGMGSFQAIDMITPTATTESLSTVFGIGGYGAGIPLWVEHQAVLIRSAITSGKYYMRDFTF